MNTNRLVNSNNCKTRELYNDSHVNNVPSQVSNLHSQDISSISSESNYSEAHSNDITVHNVAWSASKIINDLCTCVDVNIHWCFIHSKVRSKQSVLIDKCQNFGFINQGMLPAPLFTPPTVIKAVNLKQWAFQAHLAVASTNCFNYQGARIKVPTELNISNWRALCVNYEDQVLLDYLEYGFPLCVDRSNFVFNGQVVNHQSAEQYPADIEAYFQKELKHNAIVGPCDDIPFLTHYSPLLSRPKLGDTHRVIVNLSAPYGASVNDAITNEVYDGVPFKLKYPTVENIVTAIEQFDSDVLLSKIDVSRAFRNLRTDPGDFDLLGLSWNGKAYLDISIPMGLKSGSALCQRTTDVIRHIMTSQGVATYNYIEDVICIHKRPNANAEFELLFSLFEFLGVPINPKKVVPPSKTLTCMGIDVNVETKQLTIPHQKIAETLKLCKIYVKAKVISKKQLQSLLGKLLYLHRCVAPARIFVNRLLNKLRAVTGRVSVDEDMVKDLNWFIQFLTQFNGTVMFHTSRPHHEVFVDASLTGMGASWGTNVYAVTRHLWATIGLNINQLEMLNVLIALRLFAKYWQNQCVEFRIDNKAVVYALQKGRIKDNYMQTVARSIWLIAASNDINLVYSHIAGTENVKADALSRLFERGFTYQTWFSDCKWWPVHGAYFFPNSFI